jgi:hypothetical protein
MRFRSLTILVVLSWTFVAAAHGKLVTTLKNPSFESTVPNLPPLPPPVLHNLFRTVHEWSEFAELLADDGAGIWTKADGGLDGQGYPEFVGDNAAGLSGQLNNGLDDAWIFQSLGTVEAGDVGTTFAFHADVGAREQFKDRSHTGNVTAAFRTGTTTDGTLGNVLGTSTTEFIQSIKGEGAVELHTITATFTPTPEDIGTPVFAVVDLHGLTITTPGRSQYIVDNTSVSTIIPFDIKPGSDPNSVNLKSKGVLPLAILSTDSFDVRDVDIDTLLFGDPLLLENGGTALSPLRYAFEDVSDDGLIDLSLKFSIPALVDYDALGPDSIAGLLTGELWDGTRLEGADSIRIVPSKGSNGNILQVRAIPEPSTLVLLCAGVGLLVHRKQRILRSVVMRS